MGIFIRKLLQNKPKQWGPFSAVQSALFHNLEAVGIDSQSIVYALPVWEGAGSVIHDYAQGDPGALLGSGIWNNNSLVEGGSNDRVRVFSDGILNQGSSNAATYSYFMDGHVAGNYGNIRVLSLRAGGGGAYSWLEYSHINGKFAIKSYSGQWLSTNTYDTGDWIEGVPHDTLAFTFDSSGDWQIFTDGGLSETVASAPTQWPLTAGIVRVGGYNAGAVETLRSALLFYGVALTPVQVAALTEKRNAIWQPRSPVFYSIPGGAEQPTLLPIYFNHYNKNIGT